jgi:hypothetical protein
MAGSTKVVEVGRGVVGVLVEVGGGVLGAATVIVPVTASATKASWNV